MNRPPVLSPRAQRDLDEIADYTLANWGEERARAYVSEMRAALMMLSNNSGIGRDCSSLRKGYRKYPVGSHLLFYRLLEKGVDVIRILHQGMDPKRHL